MGPVPIVFVIVKFAGFFLFLSFETPVVRRVYLREKHALVVKFDHTVNWDVSFANIAKLKRKNNRKNCELRF